MSRARQARSEQAGALIVPACLPGGAVVDCACMLAATRNHSTAALYKAYKPAATAAEVKAAILNSVARDARLDGRVETGGRLDCAAMLAVASCTPSCSSGQYCTGASCASCLANW